MFKFIAKSFIVSTIFTYLTFTINVLATIGLPLILMNRRWYRMFTMYCARQFGHYIVILTHLFCPCELVLTGDVEEVLKTDKLILFPNHQIYADWWYLWILAWKANSHGYLKIVSKDLMRYLPVFGWVMSTLEFIFLKRKWSTDQLNYTRNLTRAKEDQLPLWFIIFPEGTVLCEETRQKSSLYAKKMDWNNVELKHVLWPKHTGLFHACQILQDYVEYAYDCTICYSGLNSEYPYDFYPLSKVFFKGQGPRRIHIHLQKVIIKELPGLSDTNQKVDEFGTWLRQSYITKDKMITRFYQQSRLYNDNDEPHKQEDLIVKAEPTLRDYLMVVFGVLLGFQLTRFYWGIFVGFYSLLPVVVQSGLLVVCCALIGIVCFGFVLMMYLNTR